MLLKITHETEYTYDAPLQYALQRLRLTPLDGPTQQVVSWQTSIEGATRETVLDDHFGNRVELISSQDGVGKGHVIRVVASGEIETKDTAGVTGPHTGYVPLWLYLRATPLTEPGKGVRALVRAAKEGETIPRLHALMDAIRSQVTYMVGTTHSATTAEEALSHGEGVCQDHSHIFISAARMLGIPARYVSGYLLMTGEDEQATDDVQVASHAWAEAHVEDLGWIGFDVSNGHAPDERYARLAVGLDYSDAAPISGVRSGTAEESLAVSIRVEQ